MAESPDGRGVILFGGDGSENSYKYENRILELRAGADSWNVQCFKCFFTKSKSKSCCDSRDSINIINFCVY